MMKRFKIMGIFAVLFISSTLNASTVPKAGRIWNYNIITRNLYKNYGIIVIPGFKYEFLKYVNGNKIESKGLLAYEFFIGPYFRI